jgi:hypothetical protein
MRRESDGSARVAERKPQGSVLWPPKPLRLTHFVVLASPPAVLTRVPSMALSGAARSLPRMLVIERICPAAVSSFPARIFRRAVVIQQPPAAAGAIHKRSSAGTAALRRTVAQIAPPFWPPWPTIAMSSRLGGRPRIKRGGPATAMPSLHCK